MTRLKWAERLTPFTAAMALSLLVVALVVKPAWATDNPQCTACQNYWNNAAQPYDKTKPGTGKICQGLPIPSYQWDQCRWKAIHDNCFKPVAGQTYTEPCYGDPGLKYYTDCMSNDCATPTSCEDKAGNKWQGGACFYWCGGCSATVEATCKDLKFDPQKDTVVSACQAYCGCSP